MYEAAARSLRKAERFLLAPPLSAKFGSSEVAICDISTRGARFRHDKPLETGRKDILHLPIEGRPKPLALEAVVVWSERDTATSGRFLSGVRTYGSPEALGALIAQLQGSKRSNRIEELRSADRFFVAPSLEGTYAAQPVRIENLSARGGRIETPSELSVGTTDTLVFAIPDSQLRISVGAKVTWTAIKAITGSDRRTFRAGLALSQNPEMLRLAIGQLCQVDRARLDTQSLALKLKIMRARARQFAPSYKSIESSGVPAEQYLLIQGVREELRLNPEEAMHWYRRARLIINDPHTRSVAPMIVDYPDALAVWEYLDRSIDPSIVGRALGLGVRS